MQGECTLICPALCCSAMSCALYSYVLVQPHLFMLASSSRYCPSCWLPPSRSVSLVRGWPCPGSCGLYPGFRTPSAHLVQYAGWLTASPFWECAGATRCAFSTRSARTRPARSGPLPLPASPLGLPPTACTSGLGGSSGCSSSASRTQKSGAITQECVLACLIVYCCLSHCMGSLRMIFSRDHLRCLRCLAA